MSQGREAHAEYMRAYRQKHREDKPLTDRPKPRKELVRIKTPRSCAQCGEVFVGSSKKYCSDICCNRAKYERGKASGLEARKRQTRNAKYVPKPRRPKMYETCQIVGCEQPFLALSMCKSHYSRHKAYGRRKREYLIIGALVAGAGRHAICERGPFGGLFVYCTECRGMTGVRDGGRPEQRWCSCCDLVILVNADELEMLTTTACAA